MANEYTVLAALVIGAILPTLLHVYLERRR